jgi:YgiT-type zinc finger domain-containing protein
MKTAKRAKIECPVCGGAMKAGKATLPLLSGERVLVLRDVPSEICGDCGEACMSGPTLDRVEEMVAELKKLDAEVSLVHYKAA